MCSQHLTRRSQFEFKLFDATSFACPPLKNLRGELAMGDVAVATLDDYNNIIQQAVQTLMQKVPDQQQKIQLTDKASNYFHHFHGFPNALPDVFPQRVQAARRCLT